MPSDPAIEELRQLIRTVPKWHNGLDHGGVVKLMKLVDRIEKHVNRFASPPARATVAISKWKARLVTREQNPRKRKLREYTRKPNWAFLVVEEWKATGGSLLAEWGELRDSAQARIEADRKAA